MSHFRKIVPNSSVNSVNETYEHYLTWLSNDGIIRNWLFSHTDGESRENFSLKAIESDLDIRQIPIEEREEITAVTKSMDSDTFNYVKSIMGSNRVYKVGKDSSLTPVALRGGRVIRGNKLKEFELKIRFELKEKDTLNV